MWFHIFQPIFSYLSFWPVIIVISCDTDTQGYKEADQIVYFLEFSDFFFFMKLNKEEFDKLMAKAKSKKTDGQETEK